jgi:Tol biopolymer transport system component
MTTDMTTPRTARPYGIRSGSMTRFVVISVCAITAVCVWTPNAAALGAGGIKANWGTSGPHLSQDGGVVAFDSAATNLDPAHLTLDNGREIFARDLQTGVTSLVSRATGTTTEEGNGNSFEPDISANGRFVAFNSSSSNLSPFHTDNGFGVFVRDLQTNTTTVASLGIGGGNCQECFWPSISGDGRYVAFFSRTAPMTVDDTDNGSDSYVRDMQTGTNTLVSRATGANGVKGNGESFSVAISDNGRWVVFESAATNLSPDDADPTRDLYVRDLQAHTTTLVTRASGATGPKANGGSGGPEISGDGRFVAFYSFATNLHPDDTDSSADIFVRDLQTDTTALASRAGGANGEAGNGESLDPSLSADGRLVGFSSSAWNLHPDDPVSPPHIPDGRDSYVRDLQTHTTILVSRANGPDGAKGNRLSTQTSLSGDGRYAAFGTVASNLAPDDPDTDIGDVYVRDLQDHITSLEGRATPGYARYVRPKGASPLRTPLVPAVHECTTPNRAHAPPLAHGSCSPVVQHSTNLTIGIGDGNPALARSVGHVLVRVIAGDVPIALNITNVMSLSDLSDYTGELEGRLQLRITDRQNGPAQGEEGTTEDLGLTFPANCVATSSTLDGATCSASTSANALVPGFATDGKRVVIAIDRVRVFDGGPDGDADTPDNSLFAVQGIFVP